MRKLLFVVLLMVAVPYLLADETPQRAAIKEFLKVSFRCTLGNKNFTNDHLGNQEYREFRNRKNECYHACLLRGVGVLHADGTLNKSKIQAYASIFPNENDEVHNYISELLTDCGSLEIDNDICETANNITTCVRSYTENKNLEKTIVGNTFRRLRRKSTTTTTTTVEPATDK